MLRVLFPSELDCSHDIVSFLMSERNTLSGAFSMSLQIDHDNGISSIVKQSGTP